MPARRKPSRTKPAPWWPRVLPAIGVVVAAGCGATAFWSGSHALGLPFLIVVPVAGVLLLGLPVLVGMLLLSAANRLLAWRTAGVGTALALLSLGGIIAVLFLFGMGFRGYVAPRATPEELRSAAADLVRQHAREARVVLTPAEVRAGASTALVVQRLRPQSIVVDQGGRKIEPSVYFRWGQSVYDWGIEVKGAKVEYRYGTGE